jgi:hypothetical protein
MTRRRTGNEAHIREVQRRMARLLKPKNSNKPLLTREKWTFRQPISARQTMLAEYATGTGGDFDPSRARVNSGYPRLEVGAIGLAPWQQERWITYENCPRRWAAAAYFFAVERRINSRCFCSPGKGMFVRLRCDPTGRNPGPRARSSDRYRLHKRPFLTSPTVSRPGLPAKLRRRK